MKKAVFGIAKSESHADTTIQKLIDAGFDSGQISALFHDSKNRLATTTYEQTREQNQPKGKHQKGGLGLEKHTKASEGGAGGALAGGVIGGTIGLLAGIGALAIPGVGPFIAAGPIMAALGGSAVGGGVGLIIGALTGLGIPEYEAKRYEDRIKAGSVLISVECDTSDEIDRAKQVLKDNKIEDIATTKEKAAGRR